jgi:hypothetical protein
MHMSADVCLFCNGKDKKYKPETGIEFICSLCVQMLLGADQEDLKAVHTLAINNGYLNKASAIESFLTEEENEQRKPTRYNQRSADRKGTAGAVRHKKGIPGLSQKGKTPSIS